MAKRNPWHIVSGVICYFVSLFPQLPQKRFSDGHFVPQKLHNEKVVSALVGAGVGVFWTKADWGSNGIRSEMCSFESLCETGKWSYVEFEEADCSESGVSSIVSTFCFGIKRFPITFDMYLLYIIENIAREIERIAYIAGVTDWIEISVDTIKKICASDRAKLVMAEKTEPFLYRYIEDELFFIEMLSISSAIAESALSKNIGR